MTHTSICVSRLVRDQLVEAFGFPPARTVTVLNGVDFAHFNAPLPPTEDVRARLGLGTNELVLVAACRLVPAKGVDALLQAVHGLRHALPELRCIIVGEGPSAPALRQCAAALGLEGIVWFVGFQLDVRPYLRAGDIFLSPSSAAWVECLPLAVLEAMASGLPCVAPRSGAVPELISDGVEGLLVAPGSVEELRSAILRLARDPAERQGMAARARDKARQFDLERCMARIQSILLS